VTLPNQTSRCRVLRVGAAEASVPTCRARRRAHGYRAPGITPTSRTCTARRARRVSRRSQAPHPDRHLRSLARLLRRLLTQGAEIRRLIARDFTEAFAEVRRPHGPRAPSSPSTGRQVEGSGADVPGRPLYDPHQPRGAAACRSRAASAPRAGRGCRIVGSYFDEAACWRGECVQQVREFGHRCQKALEPPISAVPRRCVIERHRTRDARAMTTASKIFSGASDRIRRATEYAASAVDRTSRNVAGAEQGGGRCARYASAGGGWQHRGDECVRAHRTTSIPTFPRATRSAQFENPVVAGGSLAILVGEEGRSCA